MNNIFKIYMHRNKINNKKYIGLTCQKPSERWQKGKGYIQCPKFYFAIEKYGWDNFEHIILEDGLSKDEANAKEQYYIKLYDTINNGYNISIGGGSSYGSHRPIYQYGMDGLFIKEWHSISDIAAELKTEDASCVYACISGRVQSYYGYQWKYEKLESIPPIKSRDEILAELTEKRKKPVYQYTRSGEFVKRYDYLLQVENDGFNFRGVSKCCSGKGSSCGGFQWSYEYYPKLDKVLLPHQITAMKQSKAVYKYDLLGNFIEKYDSLSIAAALNGISFKRISSCCLGKTKTCNGFQWAYELVEKEAVKVRSRNVKDKVGKKVDMYVDGNIVKTFMSVKGASRETGIKYYKIVNSCLTGEIVDGFSFKYIADSNQIKEE